MKKLQALANTEAEGVFVTGKSRRLPSGILKRAAVRLNELPTINANTFSVAGNKIRALPAFLGQ